MAGKVPTAQGVSAALRKAGFERSEAQRGRGQLRDSEGYRVRAWGASEGEVRVEHEPGGFSLRPGPNAIARRDAKLAEYAEALRAKGWNVQTLPTGVPCLLVTMKVEE